MLAIDTNVLIYAADQSFPEHRVCRDRLEGWRRGRLPWYLTWNVLYEFLRVVTHTAVLRRPWPAAEAWRFVAALLASRSLGLLRHTSRHADVLSATLAEIPLLQGNLVHDFHTAVLLREHGIRRIVTRDTDFHRFPFLEVVDPLT